MVADEIAAYLAAAGLGLTTAAPNPNLFARPFPFDAPDQAVAIDVYGGHDSERIFGTGKAATIGEHPLFHVYVRDQRDNDASAAALAQQIYDFLDCATPGAIGSPAVYYWDIRSTDGPPKFMGSDGNNRSIYVLTFLADKARS
jgi:hypothetical protein